jgi:hypothetical protein
VESDRPVAATDDAAVCITHARFRRRGTNRTHRAD